MFIKLTVSMFRFIYIFFIFIVFVINTIRNILLILILDWTHHIACFEQISWHHLGIFAIISRQQSIRIWSYWRSFFIKRRVLGFQNTTAICLEKGFSLSSRIICCWKKGLGFWGLKTTFRLIFLYIERCCNCRIIRR